MPPEATEMSILDSLSIAQRAVSISPGNTLVTACPGAGKTRMVSARAAYLSARGHRIALTSYTNVGAQEMVDTITRLYGIGLDQMHFSGTLHRLLIRYVLRPFGHLEMNCTTVPRVEGGVSGTNFTFEGEQYNSNEFRPTDLNYFTTKRHAPPRRSGGKRQFLLDIAPSVRQAKEAHAQGGRLSNDDAMYWCARVLNAHANVSRAVSARFDEIIIDEAQDTSSLQILCIDTLKAAGLNSIFLVGDFDQSIYSFNGASPTASQSLATKYNLTQQRLNENRRSSQAICNLAAKLRGNSPDVAVGPHRNFGKVPSITFYDPDTIDTLPKQFESRISGGPLDLSNSAIIARGNALVHELEGRGEDLPAQLRHTRPFMRLSLDKSLAPDSQDLEQAERYLWSLLSDYSTKTGIDARSTGLAVRAQLMSLVDRLPDEKVALNEWVDSFNVELVSAISALGIPPPSAPSLLSLPSNLKETPVREAARSSAPDQMTVTTVHGVKGKSLDAVLLVAAPASGMREQATSWAGYISRTSSSPAIATDEDARVLYVAITRAQRVFQLALPSTTNADTVEKFISAGFVRVKDYC